MAGCIAEAEAAVTWDLTCQRAEVGLSGRAQRRRTGPNYERKLNGS